MEDPNPIQHFQQWFYEVDRGYPNQETNAMILSTLGLDGFPKSRVVLLKRFTWEGFIFFTNYQSDKGKAIATNPSVSLLFDWSSANRAVSIQGMAEKITKNVSEGYFEIRPKGSKLSAWVSQQSEVIASRSVLEEKLKKMEEHFKNKEIPMPDYWGGYLVKPLRIEFLENDPLTDTTRKITYILQQDYDWEVTTIWY